MNIFYFMIEAVPNKSNPESRSYGGAYVNVWIKAATKEAALIKAKRHIFEEDWRFIQLEDAFIAYREQYARLPESLECYDTACESGLASIFNTWPLDDA